MTLLSKLRAWNPINCRDPRTAAHGNGRKALTLREVNFSECNVSLLPFLVSHLSSPAPSDGWVCHTFAMPVSTLGVAYVIGARVALTADHVHAIAKGQTPTFEFRRMAQNPSNKYVWQRGKIERPAACLYDEADAGKGAIVRPRSCPDQDRISMSGDQLYFSVESGDALRIGVSNKPLENRTVTNGALYEAEGEIGIGKSTRTRPGSRLRSTRNG